LQHSGPGAYGWPLKPFDREHPVRGLFGDPRTVFSGPPTQETLRYGGGQFSFHFGVDIVARDNTAVYPVESGTVTEITPEHFQVSSGARSFQYWHLSPLVRLGQHVVAFKTVIGRTLHGHGHLHLAELDGGRAVNPLQPGHLTPYADRTPPRVVSISFRAGDTGPELLSNFVSGPLLVVVEAYDPASPAVRGAWAGMPVVPALITWRLQRLGGKVVLPERVAVDFRKTLPPNARFWDLYARGTFQNFSVFGRHYSWAEPGVYLFKLTRSPIDTRSLPDGVYDFVVTARDVRGNSAVLSKRFTLHNRPGWVGS